MTDVSNQTMAPSAAKFKPSWSILSSNRFIAELVSAPKSCLHSALEQTKITLLQMAVTA